MAEQKYETLWRAIRPPTWVIVAYSLISGLAGGLVTVLIQWMLK